MNKLNFTNTGGFPLDTNILSFMQDAYDLLNALGEMAGDLAILQGCTITGSSVADGVVFINGEVLAFKGGTGTQVVIKEDVTPLPFEDGESKEVEKERYATFGIASVSYAWADFVRINPLKTIQRAVVPVGLISMWSGAVASVPDGWALCDGANGTPDLRGRFIVGAGGSYTPGNTGGEEKHQLSVGEMPTHTHTGSTNSAGGHTHRVKDGEGGSSTNSVFGEHGDSPNFAGADHSRAWVSSTSLVESAGAHSHTLTLNSQGGNSEHENRPPYYALAYIIFKG